jgi:hypothetical protein
MSLQVCLVLFGDIRACSRHFGFFLRKDIQQCHWSGTSASVSLEKVECDCVPHHAVLIAPGLWLASPKNGNISYVGWRLSAISPYDCSNWEHRDGEPIRKKPQLAGICRIYGSTIFSFTTEDSNFHIPDWKKPFEVSTEFPHFSTKFGVGDFCNCRVGILDTHPSPYCQRLNSRPTSGRPPTAFFFSMLLLQLARCRPATWRMLPSLDARRNS